MWELIKRIWKVVADFTQAWSLLIWLLPAGAVSVVTAWLAKASSLPLYLVVLYAAAAFCIISVAVAAIYHALLRRYEFNDKITAENKLDFVGPHFAVDVKWSNKGVPLYIEKMNIGMVLRNLSKNEIHAKVVSFHATLEGRAPNTDRYVGKILTVLPMTASSSQPERVDLEDLKKLEIKGTMECTVLYGRPGNLKHTLSKNVEFDFVVHQKNSVRPNPNVGVSVRDRTQ